ARESDLLVTIEVAESVMCHRGAAATRGHGSPDQRFYKNFWHMRPPRPQLDLSAIYPDFPRRLQRCGLEAPPGHAYHKHAYYFRTANGDLSFRRPEYRLLDQCRGSPRAAQLQPPRTTARPHAAAVARDGASRA